MFDTARGNTLSSKIRKSIFARAISLAAAFSLASWPVLANPQGGTVAGGNANISQSPGSTIINQTSSSAIINWNDFSIGAGELTKFNTPGASAATLNRVTGGNLSSIYGTLASNGQVYLINPNGILIGATGRINTQGFLASTLDIDDAVFMRGGDLMFKGNSNASVVNLGIINAGAGDVFMFAQRVENHGSITAGGHVGLAAGSEILLKGADSGKGRVMVRAGKGSVANSGDINAAVAELRAAGGNHYALAINNTGVVRATGVTRRGGRVYLSAKRGRIRNRGRIIAKRSRGRGGKVVIRVKEQGAIDLSGEINVVGSTGRGGLVVVEAEKITIADGATIDASGATGGGEIYVGGGERGSAVIRTSYVEDGDQLGQGEEITVVAAKSVTVEKGASIIADATETGDGGKLVLWSDGTTTFAGLASANAQGADGKGGDVEISGKEHLSFTGSAVASGRAGAGTVLFDPGTVTIVADTDGDTIPDFADVNQTAGADADVDGIDDAFDVDGGAAFDPTLAGVDPAQLTDTFIDTIVSTTLQGGVSGTNVTIATAGATAGAEDINIAEGVRIGWNQESTLRMEAGNNVNALEDVLIQHSGDGDALSGGGIIILAGNDINIGSASRADNNANLATGVAIGSEYGSNIFVAGDSNFDQTSDKAGSVILTGGETAGLIGGGFSQLGYIMGTTRSDAGVNDTANGTIIVQAGSDVTLIGGGDNDADGVSTIGAFAQIGHGGTNIVNFATGETIASVADIVGDIQVTAGVVTGDVNLSSEQGAGFGNYAQIGQGAALFTGTDNHALTHGNISGDISVAALNSDINLNATFTSQATPDGVDDVHLAQIGSGGHMFYVGSGLNGTEATHGNIQGDVTIDADGVLTLGTLASADAPNDRYIIQSQVGHGGHIRMDYDGTDITGDSSLDAVHGRIASFDTGIGVNGSSNSTNIDVTAASINILAQESVQNSGGTTGHVIDNLQRSQIGHGQHTVVEDTFTGTLRGVLDISVTEGDIAGNITVRDDDATDGAGILLSSTITGTATATTGDAMITRIGHGSQSYLNSHTGYDGDPTVAGAANVGQNAFRGGDITVNQAHILGADISVTTSGVEGNNQDISVITNITAGNTAVEDNTAVAQIGHSGDIFAHSGDGGAGRVGQVFGGASGISGTSARGGDIRINKGTIWDGSVGFALGGGTSSYGGSVAVNVNASNQVIIDSDTAAALASANRNNSESQIGSGHRIRLATGNGGTAADAASGGRGGDVLITQITPTRDYGGSNDTARGIRGTVTVTATNTLDADFALDITSDDTAALSPTNNNTDRSQLGHGDIIEIVAGNGGAGGTANANDPANLPVDGAGNLVQSESFGGRGGDINVALGDMLIESDVFANISGAARINSTATNALSPSTRNIVESFMGHGQYIQAHAGDGAVGGEADFLANASGTQNGNEYAPQGVVGGRGGDIDIAFGDITDRVGTGAGATHNGEADVQIIITNDNTTPNSMTILAETVHALGESVGNDVYAGLGHHQRFYGEGGQGANGGSTRTEFDNFIQPESTGGRGGDVVIASGDIRGDVIADMPRQLLVESKFGHGTFTKVIATVGHTTDLVSVSQNGGNAGNLREDNPSGCTAACNDGGIDNDNANSNTAIFIDAHTADSNDATEASQQDVFNIADTNGDGHPDDGIDTNGDGVSDTVADLVAGGAVTAVTNEGTLIDVDGDGVFDFVDFDPDGPGGPLTPDGKIDIVDIDQDGVYDRIDGRDGTNGRMDYPVVTGQTFDMAHQEGGWTLNDSNATGGFSRGGDFSTANGGRGGDATTRVGLTIGDIEIDTGNPTQGEADSLIVRATQTDLVAATGGPRDLGIARIGHGSFQFSDTAGSYSNRNAGRVETQRLINNDLAAVQGHNTANGGNAGYFAINASGGRGGDAFVIQGVNGTHLSGNIYINMTDDEQPLDLRVGRLNASDAKRITVQATATTDAGTGLSIAQIGHGAEGAASAGDWRGLHGPLINSGEGNTGGNGASTNDGVFAPGDSSQTEVAIGGRGGDAVLTQAAINGDVFVQTGADDGDGSNDFSLQIIAEKSPPIVPAGPNDIVVAQIGHGRVGQVSGGNGGLGDDGQWKASGGRGGDVTLTQNRISSNILIDLVDTADGYSGNGMRIDSSVAAFGQHIVRAQAGHGDLAFAEGGTGGNGNGGDASLSWVIEQLNQRSDGGRGGDVLINQAGYTGNLTTDIGPNLSAAGANGLEIRSHSDTVNVAPDNHILASLGHGGYAQAISNAGGNAGNRDGLFGITSGEDRNLRDGIDNNNRILLGTDRNGGRGGNIISNIGVGGTTGDIVVNVHDDNLNNAAAGDGILVWAQAGDDANRDRSIDTNTAMIGHHGFNRANATAAIGGDGIQTTLSATITTGDGGDGGDATATHGFISGDITLTNNLDGGLSNNGDLSDTNILIQTVDESATDSSDHRADARAGHFTTVEALAGAGGNSAREDGPPPSFPATVSAQGGNGGQAITDQGQLYGNILITAENSVQVRAEDGTVSSPTLVSVIGHRVEADARGAIGGDGGTAQIGSQNLYFIYEALREYEANGRNLSALSSFERQLISPFITDEITGANHTGYFNDKYMGHFLDRLLRLAQTSGAGGNSGANDRDDNFIGGTNFTIPALTAEEQETLLFVMAATGDGGHASIQQGSTLNIGGNNETRSVNGNITINALSRDLTDADRGILVRAQDTAAGGGYQLAQIGHQAEVIKAQGGDGQDIKAFDDSIGGDGGGVSVIQNAFDGFITLNSSHKIKVHATDPSIGGGYQRASVGHRLTIGQDRPDYRLNPVVIAGNGGSGAASTADERNGNGGNVFIRQDGVITNDTDTNIDITLSALSDADDGISISILADAAGGGSPGSETHIGHDMLIASVKAGNAGQRHANHGNAGLDIGIREGNGGDIRISQGDIGADIDIVGKDIVEILTTTALADNAHIIIGHERTIGETSDTHNNRTGTIIAGFGGDSQIEDYNNSAEIDSWTGIGTLTGQTTDVEDADAGVIHITHGTLGGSRASGTDTEVITITSLTEDVDVISKTGTAGSARTEIGNAQHVHAQTLEASLPTGNPQVRTAGDGGDIRITRGEIRDDILIQALDQENKGNREVRVETITGLGGEALVLIGHETEFDISTSTGTHGAQDQSSGFGEARFADLDGSLAGFVALTNPTAVAVNVAGQATLRDANQALQDLRNTVAVLTMANENADRYDAANQTDLAQALADAQGALTAAEAAFAALDAGTVSEAQAVANVQAAATNGQTALNDGQAVVTGAGINADNQIADHADAGSILYTANDAINGGTITNEGLVSGNVLLISGRDTGASGSADTFDTGLVHVTSTTGAGGTAHTELGHRRTMTNTTGQGGGDTNGGPDEGGVAGDGGDITIGDTVNNNLGDIAQRDGVTGNRTSGDVTLTADEVVVHSTGGGGTSETHLGHDVIVTNFTDQSDLEGLLGNGGNIYSAQTVGGGVTINANHLSKTDGAEDSIIGASGLADSVTHLGHQVDADNDSRSDETIGGTGGDEANRAGEIITAQETSGNALINLDLDGDGNPNDITVQSDGAAPSDTRLGHIANQDAFSGDPTDDGSTVVAHQLTTGNISITNVEDVIIESIGAANNPVHIGHDAVNTAQSGDVNGGTGDEFGGFVDADQTVSGAITVANGANGVRSYTQRTGAASSGEVHVGHEGSLTALSGDDGTDASRGAGEALRRSRDVDADQTITAAMSIRAGEILLESANSQRVQFGHEAFITVDTDGGARTTGLDEAAVHSRSFINPVDANGDAEDITIIASTTNIPTDDDAAIVMASADVQGDLKLEDKTAAGEVQIGHRSTSDVSHAVGNQPTGLFDTLHAIGGIADADGNTEIDDTAASTITVATERDLEVLDSIGGIAQIGHYITEDGPLSATGAVQAGSLVRQTVGSDIVIGDDVTGTGGVGNNLVMVSTGGRSEIGHRSPGSNEWQGTTGGALVTPQILDGNITILVGTDAGGTINGAAPGNTDAGGDDDALLDGTAGGVVRIGHNHTDDAEASGNEVQVSAGDVYLEVDSDLHVLTANIGHEHYDHDDLSIDTNNAIEGLGSIRNRIRGNTIIGAAQSSPSQNSTLLADVMKFDGANVNSGYGGRGNRDVNGQLRFFIPAQENLTIVGPVAFNDSVSAADDVTDRSGDPSNVFAGTGGNDHEHTFTTISRNAAYTDQFIGDGNFTFYFENPPRSGVDIDFAHPIRKYLHDSLGGGLDYSTSDMYVGRTLQFPTYSGYAGYSSNSRSGGSASGNGVIAGQDGVIRGSISARAGYEPEKICGAYGSNGIDCHQYDEENFTVIEGYRGLVEGSNRSAPAPSGNDDGSFVTGVLTVAPSAPGVMVTQQVPGGSATVATAAASPLVTVQPTAPSNGSSPEVIIGQAHPYLVPTKVSSRGWVPRAMAQIGGGVAIE